MDGICQEYSLPHWTKSLLMWQNILPCVYKWIKIDELFGWKSMKKKIVEEVWTTQVDEQGFKGWGIHSESIVP